MVQDYVGTIIVLICMYYLHVTKTSRMSRTEIVKLCVVYDHCNGIVVGT